MKQLFIEHLLCAGFKTADKTDKFLILIKLTFKWGKEKGRWGRKEGEKNYLWIVIDIVKSAGNVTERDHDD